MKDRLELAGIGAIAGLCLWSLFELLPDVVEEGFLLLALTVGASVFFSVLMALVGPERPLRAVLPSLALGGLTGLLALWSGLRFQTVDGFFDAGHPLMALFVIALVGAPFAAATLEDRAGWRDYARLFDSAWGIFIRYVAGWLFAGLIFVVLLLSDELLKLVGIRIIDDLLDIDWLRYTLVGAVFGLGVATVHELREYVSPVLVHRLLRMLLPLVLVVVIVFIGALPFRGLSDLFGKLSTAGVLMAVAFAGVTLITAAIDRDDENASEMKLMTFSARIMALLIPVLVGLAIYAVWIRIAAYGWTPQRGMAAYTAVFLIGYVGWYLWSVLSGAQGWQGRLRQSNLYMALVVWGGAVLWLTPLAHVEALSVRSQVARFEAGTVKAAELPLYEMAHDWGRVGEAGLAKIETMADAPLKERIVAAREAKSVWQFKTVARAENDTALRAKLTNRIKILPEGEGHTSVFEAMERGTLMALERHCPEGTEPSCAIVMLGAGADAVFSGDALLVAQEQPRVWTLRLQSGQYYLQQALAYDAAGRERAVPENLFEQVTAGAFELKPKIRNVLGVGDLSIIPYN